MLILSSMILVTALLVTGEVRSHDYMEKDCVAYLEIDAKLRQDYLAGIIQPHQAGEFLRKEYSKIYKGPVSKSPLVMEQLLMQDRQTCPKLPPMR